jgi:hypothetical protein
MATPPTTLVISYGTSSTATLSIPAGIDFTQATRNLATGGGFWFVSAAGVQTFIPWSQITQITAQ